jgi:hypothetical protein
MPLIRKDRAGNDSLGHTWTEDGAVVDMPHEEAEELLAIPDGGFTLVLPDAESDPEPDGADPEPPDGGEHPVEPEPDANPEISEIDPDAPPAEPDAKPAAKKTAAKKTAARKPASVEE